MSIKNKLMLTVAAGLALGASSCRKFMNVNTNPNISQTATLATLLPAAQLWVGSSLGVDLEVNGSIWSQYWTQAPVGSQYNALEAYGPTSPGQDFFAVPWKGLYMGAENFYQLAKLADSSHNKPYKAISLIMQAYTFQLLTDGWGDIPFTQALKGAYADGHIISPKYDSQLVVYRGIITYVDSAKKLLQSNYDTSLRPHTDDLIYGGDMDKWTRFANTLKLRALVRMSGANPSGVQVMIDSFYATGPTFLGYGDDAQIKGYGANTANNNPLYAEEVALGNLQNLAASATCIDSMNNNGDYRLDLFYEPYSNRYVGVPQGASVATAVTAGSYSIPSTSVGGDASLQSASANAPVNFMTASESYFLQAEIVARGWQASSSAMSDDSLFLRGIRANFLLYNASLESVGDTDAYGAYITGGGYWTTYPTTGSFAQKQRFIITQKWFAMCGNQGFEAWTEWRRTGYPDFFVTPISASGDKPRRFLYPTSESSANSNFPGLKSLATKVWWDVR